MSTHEADALDQADMARLAAGHEAALSALMDRHAGALFGFLCRFVRDEDAANDLAQETFVRVYQHRTDFRPEQKFSTWLFTIGGNLARNHLRARARRPEVPFESSGDDDRSGVGDTLPAPGKSPDEQAECAEKQAAVREAVADLPDDLREAIVLCELEDRSLAEAAGILATTVKAVESRLYRARQQLRSRLTHWLAGT
ncbi:MAG TPA: sigma-70 family RNA polymerase sigma factor [Candidatus Limnocylindria bacterium]|jgi:RNA polymerase sigma-70 factor (ECF subfamily)|nr:sigma-70 family RNA polymerase sigma factor [Candidatus Limnocylindria bacterium]